MLSYTFLSAWFLAMFPLVYSPGPANTLFASNGARFGFKRSLPFMAGINASFMVQSLFVGFGLHAVLQTNPVLFEAIRYGGIAYLIYLAWRFVNAAAKNTADEKDCLGFVEGLAVTMLNPKAWMMQAVMFSQFLESGKSLHEGVLTLTILITLLNITGHVVWVLFGKGLSSSAMVSARAQNSLFAAMLLASIYFLV